MERLLAASHERKGSVFAAMHNPVVQATFQLKTRQAIEGFVGLIERTRAGLQNAEFAQDPQALQKWADRFLNEIGYFDDLRRSEKNVEAADARVRSVKDLMVDLDAHMEHGAALHDRLQGFLEEVTLDNDREEEEEKVGDAVTLITMHSCKGLEYPHVFVVGLEDGLLPHSRSKLEGTMDEERRLFYVAITRAQERLTLSHCESRKKYGQSMPCQPSPFLKELPEHLVEHSDEKSKVPVTVETGKSMFDMMRAAIE
jgi:superfamily I DNA/RNA helicase